jgi:uncharacterized LabA/DUF88 family protein
MDRTAVFIDAGYLFAAGSTLIAGQPLKRAQLNLDCDAVLELIKRLVTEVTGLPLLRVYWYDGTNSGPTMQQQELGYKPSVKLRLGFVNREGQQKGVDSLIVTDMINLARNRAMSDVLLMTGDDDIRVGVQQAQEFGVRVHLLGISPARYNQSGYLVQEADSLLELKLAEVQSFLTRSLLGPLATAQSLDSSVEAPVTLEEVARLVAKGLSANDLEAVVSGEKVPKYVDAPLLKACSDFRGRRLDDDEKARARDVFREACIARRATPP